MKIKLFPILLFCIVFICSTIFITRCFALEVINKSFTGMINDNSVNIRSGAGVNFEILRKMDKTELVLVQASILDWYKIKLPRNSKAFVHKEFISMDGKSFAHINADRVNVRAGKGTNFNVLGQLNEKDLIEVVEPGRAWTQIFSEKHCYAWVNKNFVTNQGPATIYTSKENVNQEAWKLLQQAKTFEQSNNGITDITEKKAACIQKYKAIIRDYPKTAAAISAKKHITILSRKKAITKKPKAVVPKSVKIEPPKQATKQVKPQVVNQAKNVLVKPNGNPIAQGKIIEAGRFFFRPGTHKLIKNDQIKYFLKSKTINLNTYIYHKIQVWGKIISSDKTKIPTIEVEYVNQLN